MDEIALEKNEAFYSTFEFKGVELQPFSEGRRATAASIGVRFNSDDSDDGDGFLRDKETGEILLDGKGNFRKKPRPFSTCITDIHAIIFICLCDRRTCAKAHRDPDGFWEKVLEWADENVTPADYEAEANLATRILEAAFSTQVEEAPSLENDVPNKPSGN